MKKLALVILGLASWMGCSEAFILSDFETPESVVTDREDGSYYVSNINGETLAKDGNGYISKISSNGTTVTQKYIGGTKDSALLDAPKGMAILGKKLYVSDIDTVKVFDTESRALIKTVLFPDWTPKFLNDVTVDGKGAVYVSDMMTNRIFKIDAGGNDAVSLFAHGPQLGQPNGLVFNPKTKNLMIVTFGSGQILELDAAKKTHVLKSGLKTLDGIDYDNQGNLYVSSFENGEIYRIGRLGRGALTTTLSNLITPADVSYDRTRDQILVPSFKGNTVTTVPASN